MRPLAVLGSLVTSSEQIAYCRIQGNACPVDNTDDVGDLRSSCVVSIQGEMPSVVLLVGAQGDLLEEASRTGRVPDTTGSIGGVVAKPGKMIQRVCVLSAFFPNTHAPLPILRRSYGIHDLRSIAMPSN